MMQHRKFDVDKDFEMMQEWCAGNKFPKITRGLVSENGIVITYQDNPIALGFLISTDVDLALIEFIVANPTITDSGVREVAIKAVIKSLEAMAFERGYSGVYSTMTNRNLMVKFRELGYESEERMTNFYKYFTEDKE